MLNNVPQVVFRLSTEEGDEDRHIALRQGGQVLCGVEPSPERPTPGGSICRPCRTGVDHVRVLMGDGVHASGLLEARPT